jgi:hypothetical protein
VHWSNVEPVSVDESERGMTALPSMLGWSLVRGTLLMSLESTNGRSGLRRLDAHRDEAFYFRLALDYERWGLSPEAEVARLRARQVTIERLLIGGEKAPRQAPAQRSR